MTQPIHPMLERVARAIAQAQNAGSPSEPRREDWICARAAIQALLEPDEGMVEAGWRSMGESHEGRPVWKCAADVQARHQFQAMLKPLLGDEG